MGITARHIVQDIIEIASSGSTPNEFKIEEEQILYWVNQTRSKLISEAIKNRQTITDSWLQTIGCLELEQKDISDCCLVSLGCMGLKSKKQLPSTIETHIDNNIVSVTGLDGNPISKTNRFAAKYKQYNKYTGKNMGYFIKDNYLYVINDKIMQYVTVIGLFEDPSELKNFVDCSGNTCWSMDSDYPVTQKMASQITDIVLKTKVLPFMQFPADNKNDAANITSQPQAKE